MIWHLRRDTTPEAREVLLRISRLAKEIRNSVSTDAGEQDTFMLRQAIDYLAQGVASFARVQLQNSEGIDTDPSNYTEECVAKAYQALTRKEQLT